MTGSSNGSKGFIDLFGLLPAFNFRGSPKSHSGCGMFSTFLFGIFCLWSLYHVGNDIIYKEKPNTVQSTIFVEDPEEIMIGPNSFTFAFGLERPDTFAHYINDQIYTVKAYHFNQKRVPDEEGNIQLVQKWTDVEVEVCTPDHFGDLGTDFANLELHQLYCFKKDQPNLDQLSIKGKFEVDEVSFLRIGFSVCNNETSTIGCASPDEIEFYLAGSYFASYYTDVSIDPNNFTYPAKGFKDCQFTTFGKQYFKEYQMWVRHLKMDSDQGWLFEDHIKQDFYGYDFMKELIDFRDFGDQFFEFQVRVSPFYQYTDRSYIKMQDILANVEGLIMVFVVIVAIAVLPYVKVKFYEELVNEAFDIHIYKQFDGHGGNQANKKDPYSEFKELKTIPLPTMKTPKAKPEKKSPKKPEAKIPVGQKLNQSLHEDKDLEDLNPLRKEFSPMNRTEFTPFNQDNKSSITNIPTRFTLDLRKVSLLDQPGLGSAQNLLKKQPEKVISFKTSPRNTKAVQNKRVDKPDLIARKTTTSFGNHPLVEKLVGNHIGSKNVSDASILEIGILTTDRNNGDENNSGDKETVIISDDPKYKETMEIPVSKVGNLGSRTNLLHPPVNPDSKFLNEYGDIDENEFIIKSLILNEEDQTSVKVKRSFTNLKLSEEGKIQVNVFDYMRSFFTKDGELQKKVEILNEGRKRIVERLDIFNVLKKLREVDKLKALLLDRDQLTLFDHLPKPVLDLESREQLYERLSESHAFLRNPHFVDQVKHNLLVNSYKHLEKKEVRSPIDEKLLNIYNELLL